MAKQEEHFETPAKRGTAIKQGAKNKEPEMTMEEYLLSQLDTPVVLNRRSSESRDTCSHGIYAES